MKTIFIRLLFVGLFTIGGCATLPYPPPETPKVHSMAPAERGTLAEVSLKFAETHEAEQSGFLLLAPNDVAFRWRLALIDHAVESIDVQYFIWQNDETGVLLFYRLLKPRSAGP
jgi:putative cardiolipin synthase